MSLDFNTWIRQPSTLHGLGVVAAGIGAALAQITTGSPGWDAIIAVGAYALVHLGIDDHSAAEQAVTRTVLDSAVLVTSPSAGQAPKVLLDVAQLGQQIGPIFSQGSAVAVPTGQPSPPTQPAA
ncbi:MAG TPA: hypothetical protein VGC09_23005 [Rhodopila sp.]